jgi:2-keto-3-deoxy-L-rhamnonate aldolase RhmA
MKTNKLKAILDAGKVPVGTVVFEFATTGIGQMAENAGADFIVFEMEHSGFDFETVKTAIAATRGLEITPIVRVPTTNYEYCAKAMDIGAQGIIGPMIETRQDAETLARSIRYHPDGVRGVALGIAHDNYSGGNPAQKLAFANANVMANALIETKTGVENADEIVSTPGIDAAWIGQFDLTTSLGIPGDFEHPDFHKAVATVMAACQKHGKVCGMMVPDPSETQAVLDAGFGAIMYSGDVWLYGKALGDGIAEVRSHLDQ